MTLISFGVWLASQEGWIYARANLIKPHKAQFASGPTSCRSPLANQMRLILHTAAYWFDADRSRR
jgi:hypothetical protein